MARRRSYKRDRNGKFARVAGSGKRSKRAQKPTIRAGFAKQKLADRKKYDRAELRYNREMARRINPKRDLSKFDYMSKSGRAKYEAKNAKLAARAKETRGSRGPLISAKTVRKAAIPLGVAGALVGANQVVVSKGITQAHVRRFVGGGRR